MSRRGAGMGSRLVSVVPSCSSTACWENRARSTDCIFGWLSVLPVKISIALRRRPRARPLVFSLWDSWARIVCSSATTASSVPVESRLRRMRSAACWTLSGSLWAELMASMLFGARILFQYSQGLFRLFTEQGGGMAFLTTEP